MRWYRRVALSAVLVSTSAVFSSCLRSTEAQPSLLHLSGSWNYSGEQTNPVREVLTGTLEIANESGTSFQGRLDIVGFNSQTGQSRALNGIVSGTEENSSVIDFDADVESTPRRHVGQLVGDTITGTWVGASANGIMSSGTFRAERRSR
jgi:hypothetical protein